MVARIATILEKQHHPMITITITLTVPMPVHSSVFYSYYSPTQPYIYQNHPIILYQKPHAIHSGPRFSDYLMQTYPSIHLLTQYVITHA